MPNGPRITITRTDSRASAQNTTDHELQMGPGPDRIDRLQRTNNMGKTGPRGVSFYPMTGGLRFVGHVPTIHIAQGVTPQPSGNVDDRAQIPAVFAGNPL